MCAVARTPSMYIYFGIILSLMEAPPQTLAPVALFLGKHKGDILIHYHNRTLQGSLRLWSACTPAQLPQGGKQIVQI